MITQFTDNVPVAETGFGLPLTHYASGRIAAAVTDHGGICDIRYNGRQHHAKNLFFKASEVTCWDKLCRLQVVIDGEAYYPEFNRTRHYPFGFASECNLAGVELRHELVLDQDTLFQRIMVVGNPEGREVRARLLLHGHLWAQVAGRTCGQWTISPETGHLQASVEDAEADGSTAVTAVQVGANQKCRTSVRHETFKYYMETACPSAEIVYYMAFNPQADQDFSPQRVKAVFATYDAMLENGLHFDTGNPTLDSALANAAPMVAHLAVLDQPGAIRASQRYWIWGWDSMVHAEALLWGGHPELVRDMLDFYRETADPVKGVAHAFNSDMTYFQAARMADNAQMLYAAMLYNYLAATGDRETVERNLDFARWIQKRASDSIGSHGDLAVGFGFFPDDRWALGHNRKDLSLINNSLFYQGLRALAAVEAELGHDAESAACLETADKVRAGMESILWDSEKGYWFDSASSEDGSPRPHYPLYGQLYVSPFGAEPKAAETAAIAEFMRANFRFDWGLYMFPTWDAGFMADGNQLGAYYPPVDRYYWTIMNRDGHAEAAADFERIVTYFWARHTYPEGFTHETVNADPTLDKPGGKQAFSAKAWLCDALELHLGLKVDLQGITLTPLPGECSFRVANLILREHRIDIERSGNGAAARFSLNDSPLANGRITWEMLKSTNFIQIEFN
jgi:hypothetical protein